MVSNGYLYCGYNQSGTDTGTVFPPQPFEAGYWQHDTRQDELPSLSEILAFLPTLKYKLLADTIIGITELGLD